MHLTNTVEKKNGKFDYFWAYKKNYIFANIKLQFVRPFNQVQLVIIASIWMMQQLKVAFFSKNKNTNSLPYAHLMKG